MLMEEEAASDGEGTWFAKRGLRAHNPGSLRAVAVTKIRRYASQNARIVHPTEPLPGLLDDCAFTR